MQDEREKEGRRGKGEGEIQKELELQNTFTNESRRGTLTSTGEVMALRHEHGVSEGFLLFDAESQRLCPPSLRPRGSLSPGGDQEVGFGALP